MLLIPWTSSLREERCSSFKDSIFVVILVTSSWRSLLRLSKDCFTSSLKTPNLLSILVSESTINLLYVGTSSPTKLFTASDKVSNSSFISNTELEFKV